VPIVKSSSCWKVAPKNKLSSQLLRKSTGSNSRKSKNAKTHISNSITIDSGMLSHHMMMWIPRGKLCIGDLLSNNPEERGWERKRETSTHLRMFNHRVLFLYLGRKNSLHQNKKRQLQEPAFD